MQTHLELSDLLTPYYYYYTSFKMNTYIYKGDWKIKSSKEEYSNPWISLVHHEVITPGGTDGIYGEVQFKNVAIGIIPIDEEGYTWRVGQFRFPLNAYSWEIPEGGGPHDEPGLNSAQRELREEVGYEATHWEKFLEMDLSNSVSNERAEVYLAKGLTFLGTQHEDTENLTLERLHFSELYAQVLEGSIRDSISVAAVLKLAVMYPELLQR